MLTDGQTDDGVTGILIAHLGAFGSGELKTTEINFSPGCVMGAQWLSGRVLDSRPKGRGFEPHRRHCVVSLSKNINPSLVLVHPRKTRPFITERLLMGRKESNQTNKTRVCCFIFIIILSGGILVHLKNPPPMVLLFNLNKSIVYVR